MWSLFLPPPKPKKFPQRFYPVVSATIFRRISVRQIADNLQKIAQTEGIKISDKGLAWIAAAGDGSMRDAQSIFDQAISYAGSEIQDHDLKNFWAYGPAVSFFAV